MATIGGFLGIPVTLLPGATLAAEAVAASAAPADAPAVGAAADASSPSLVEIVVTAQKRTQSINDVGMSITAVTDAQLRDLGVRDISALTKIEPSFIVSNASYGSPVYSIRGVGYNEKSLAASPAVSVYVDEVPFAYPALTKGATLDLRQVEVLKGPQGTLFGQNATGGAINYIAAKPTDKSEAGYELTYARFGALNLNGYISGPISQTLSARVAFNADEGGAWQRSVTRGDSLGNQNNFQGRILLDWNPRSDLHFALNLNGWTDKSDALAAQLQKPVPQDTYLIPLLAGNPPVQQQLINLVARQVAVPVVLNSQAADWQANQKPSLDQTFYQIALRGSYEVSDSIELTSISSYEHYRQNDFIDNDATAIDSNNETERGNINSLSQELRASGRLLDDRVNWLGGLAYANDRVVENNIGGLPESTPSYAFTAFGLPKFDTIGIYGASDATTKAAFGNLEYKILPELSIHGGVRYTKSDIKFSGCLYNTDQNFANGIEIIEGAVKGAANVIPIALGQCETLNSKFDPALVRNSLDQNNVSWRTGLDWHLAPDQLLYVSASKGFKAGSFPVLPGTGAIQFQPATQESVLAYEVGYKGELLERTVALDAAYFHYNYKNKQLLGRILDPAGVFGVIDSLVNVPQSTEDGVELSATWRPVTGLSLNVAGTFLDARVAGTFNSYDPFTGIITNFDGYRFPNTPKWVGSTGARYEWPIMGDKIAFIGADYRYQTSTQGSFVSRADYAPGAEYAPGYSAGSLNIASYGLLDMRAGISSADGRWRVQLWGKNVANKYYWTQAVHVYDTTVRYTGMPATYGITVGYKFKGI